MAFRIPNFNLVARLWRKPNLVMLPPDLSFPVNLTLGRRGMFLGSNVVAVASASPPSELLCPALTDVRGIINANATDLVEVPQGSGRFYVIAHVDDVAKGFANEYRLAIAYQLTQSAATIFQNTWGATLWPAPAP